MESVNSHDLAAESILLRSRLFAHPSVNEEMDGCAIIAIHLLTLAGAAYKKIRLVINEIL